MNTRFEIIALTVNNPLQNYIWMLVDWQQRHAVAVDPTEARLVLDYLSQHQLQLAQIWISHKHPDHIAGLPQLRAQTAAQVYIPRAEQASIGDADIYLEDADQLFFAGLNIEVIETKGHTLGHLCFYIEQLEAVFSGDTLFAMGCGRVFEGSYAQMYHSLLRLAALPAQTRVYCAHEYTESNARFALSIEPDNPILQQRYLEVQALRRQQQITLPSQIGLELQTNPFLRCQNLEEFQKVRQLKDQF
jgi:hydroxyacylglutathione hydrolase